MIRHTKDPKVYVHCPQCDLHYLNPAQRLGPDAERARYDLHTYAADDEGYARFTAPLIATVTDLVARGARGLDFGAGRVPLLARTLAAHGLTVALYDGFYWPDRAVLREAYDFVTSCEVVEHFYAPARDFARLRALLKPGAPLVIMTELWHGRGAFHDWSYRRDPTHVSFYSARTFRWITTRFGFKHHEIQGRVISLIAPEGVTQ